MFNDLSRRKFLMMTGGLVAAATIAPLPSDAAELLKPNEIARKKLLLVDDDPNLRLLVKDFLEFRGYDDVITAENGREALGILDLHIPNLIISDIMMPEMDGYNFLESIRRNVYTCSTPFMFFSSKGQSRDIIKGLNMGADAYMTQPFEPEKLVDIVEVLLKQKFHKPHSSKAILAQVEAYRQRLDRSLNSQTSFVNAVVF